MDDENTEELPVVTEKLMVTIPEKEVEILHTSFQVLIVSNEKGEVSSQATLFDHNSSPIGSIAVDNTGINLVAFMDSVKERLYTAAKIRKVKTNE